jgi:glycosyltransferase involved in cell wall biosynthesis
MNAGRAVFLGFTIPDEFAQRLFQADTIPAVQTHKFAWAFAEVLARVYDPVFLMSAAPVQTFPITPFRSFASLEFEENNVQGIMLAASNLRQVRHFSRFVACLKFTRRLRTDWAPDVVFVHGVHTPFLAYAAILRLFGIRTVVVLTDAPGAILATDGTLRRALKKLDRTVVIALLRAASGVVALAPALKERLAPGKPVLVVPGIISAAWQNDVLRLAQQPDIPNRRFTVTYAGGIEENYGVGLLVGAAALSPEIDFRICGRGGYLETVRATASSNVKLLGFLDQEAIAAELMQADLLINPRPSDLGFTALSFPSKLLEYLATGRPVMTTKISSIPPELNGSFYYITEETAVGVADAVRRVCAATKDERERFGTAAQQQAVDSFGAIAVARKLLAFWGSFR